MKRLFVPVLAAAALIAGAHAAAAQTVPAADFGPAIGTAIDIGTLADQTGAPRDLASLMGEKGLVLMFFRSADWCPYCQAQLIDMNAGLAGIRARGYGLAGISYDGTEVLARFTERRGIGFPLLSDLGSEIIDKYGLREERYPEGNRAYGVPKPIVFVLTREGIIAAKLFEEDYRVRPPAALVIETLEGLAGEN